MLPLKKKKLLDFARKYCAVCSFLSSKILKEYMYKYGYKSFRNITPFFNNQINLEEISSRKYGKAVLFRGMDNRNDSDGYIDPGFISTSYDINVALGFAKGFTSSYNNKYPRGTTLFVIVNVLNLNSIYLRTQYTSYYNESEILFCGPVKYVVLADDDKVTSSPNLNNFRDKIQTIVNNKCPTARYNGLGGVKVVLVALVGIGNQTTPPRAEFLTHNDPTGIYEQYTLGNTQGEMKKLQDECLIKTDSEIKLLTL